MLLYASAMEAVSAYLLATGVWLSLSVRIPRQFFRNTGSWEGVEWIDLAEDRDKLQASATMKIRSALFGDFMQHWLIILYQCFRTTYRPYLWQSSLYLENGGPIDCFEMSARNYHSTAHQIAKDYVSQVVGSCGWNSEPSGSIKCGEFLD